MDVVLEVFDTFVADYCYAKALPASQSAQVTALEPSFNNSSSLLSSPEQATRLIGDSYGHSYIHSTGYLTLQPSHYAFESIWPRDNVLRQTLSLFIITWIFGAIVYFVCAGVSYYLVFDHATFSHPKFLKNQVRMEMKQTMISVPLMAVLTTPFFLAEVRGHAKLYDDPTDAPFAWYTYLQFPFFILFTDFFIYWIHRGLHLPAVYKRLHKPHHKWIMPTPFASHAFHPLDGFSQSLPYHIFPFVFPLQKLAYIALFVFINLWTIFIHDGEYVANSPIINGAACHSMHHLYFNYNYGQFTTLWDRIGGSYRKPNAELFTRELKMGKEEWARQVQETNKMVKQVEGQDERSYDDKDEDNAVGSKANETPKSSAKEAALEKDDNGEAS